MQSPDIIGDNEVTEVLVALATRGFDGEHIITLAYKPRDVADGVQLDLVLQDAVRRVLLALVDAGYGAMTVASLLSDPATARAQSKPRAASQEEFDIRLRTQNEVAPHLVYRSKLNR